MNGVAPQPQASDVLLQVPLTYDAADIQAGLKPNDRRMLRRFWPIFVVACAAMFFIVLVFALLRDGYHLPIPWWADWIGFGGVWMAAMNWVRRRMAKQLVGTFGPWQRPHGFQFSYEGVTVLEPLSSARYRWEAFNEWVETRRVFVLRQSSFGGLVVPKRFLGGEAQIASFRQMLRQSVRAPGVAGDV
jgi:hypothetical protein